jgi:hypothetical protein
MNLVEEVSRVMTKPIPDKAEVALEYPDKLYIGTFERTARFDAHLDEFTMRCLRKSFTTWRKRYLPCRLPMRRTAKHCGMGQRLSIAPSTLPP